MTRVRYYRRHKYRVWQGYTGQWYWKVHKVPSHLDGTAESLRDAGKRARAAIDKRIS